PTLFRSLWFFATRIAEHFEFRAGWYRRGAVAALVSEYYLLLRSVLRAKPHLRACLSRCRHCRIFFLTHPRNAGRHNLRCPFGCREAHRKQQSTQRSVAYYRDPQGRKKKCDLNQRRASKVAADRPRPVRSVTSTPKNDSAKGSQPMVEHVRMVVSLIEARSVSMKEIREMLQRVLRQHSMCRRRKIDHAVAWLNENPP